ncbi:hypothetical protein E2493_20500 [Sphingomonas parva]|uniref:Uncharacterized protein n=1 Tax=Sphingomonas parva TaxID=2555898 RepID=A0A4Y8ZMJ0_9SPHN|nr:hypothetical protein [Sphingomonas parva]TFI56375.1 hypothetical protein E2493_20500 [Sphingomonas parva]
MPDSKTTTERKSAALRLAEAMQERPFAAAAIGVGAAAATAGAVLGARALARRACDGRPVNTVLKAACTAQEAALAAQERDEAEGR